MALIGYWDFANAPHQNLIQDSAGTMDLTHAGGGGAGWWRDDPDYAIFGTQVSWQVLTNMANSADHTLYSGVSFSFAMKMSIAAPLRNQIRMFGNAPFNGWALILGTGSPLTSNSDGNAKLWDGNSWQVFPTPFSTANANNKYYSVRTG